MNILKYSVSTADLFVMTNRHKVKYRVGPPLPVVQMIWENHPSFFPYIHVCHRYPEHSKSANRIRAISSNQFLWLLTHPWVCAFNEGTHSLFLHTFPGLRYSFQIPLINWISKLMKAAKYSTSCILINGSLHLMSSQITPVLKTHESSSDWCIISLILTLGQNLHKRSFNTF